MGSKPFLKKLYEFFIGLLVVGFVSGCILTPHGEVYMDSAEGRGIEFTLEAREKSQFHIMSVEELVLSSDIIAKVKVITTEPVCFRFKEGVYSQLVILKIKESLKGKLDNKVIIVYARDRNILPEYKATYEIYDELLVFLKRDDRYYFTLNNGYGQMPIYGKMLINWRINKEGKLNLNLALSYTEAKKNILEILSVASQLEQNKDKGFN